MALSDMKVFNDFIMPATIISVAQMIDKFNAASAGSIVLTAEGFTGDYMQESFFASLAAARRRVNRYSTNDPQAATPLTELQRDQVKVAGGFGPVSYEPSQLSWLRRPTQQGIQAAATAFAELLLQDQLNTAIACAVAAIENQASLTNDISGGSAGAGSMTYNAINGAHAKFGDMSGLIVADVMTGAVYHHLVDKNLTNATRLFQAGNVTVVDILNKRGIVTDAPALYEGGTPNKSKVLGLVQGGAVVSNTTDIITNIDTNNGKNRIETTFQADYTFGVGLKGYTWDTANGGKSPNDAALATGSNWDKVAQFDKYTAGVIAVADADQ